MKLQRHLSLIALTFNAACASREFENSKSASEPTSHKLASQSTLTPHGEALWQVYLSNTPLSKLQKGCEPTRVQVKPGKIQVGTAFLFHGFTACPQQYLALADKLAEQGFEVFLPLLVGHGQKRINGEEQFQDLPDEKNYMFRNDELVRSMNEIAKEASGIKVVGGLSLGGAMAARSLTLSAQQNNGEIIFDRALIMAPLFQLSDLKGKILMSTIHNLGTIGIPLNTALSMDQGWGPGCELEISATPPRAGICKFQVKHAFAAQQYGWEVTRDIASVDVSVQGVGVYGDPVVNNNLFRDVLKKMSAGNRENIKICFYPRGNENSKDDKNWLATHGKSNGANHSLLSTFDSPTENKWWIDGLMQKTVAFIVDGELFPDSTGSQNQNSTLPFCDL
ncbi:MAG: alpha/beta hydrolase [Rhodocyclaceae bacterium]|nr:alpha/beta hydrolase [Rhodocyclaceae bacterium]